MKVWVIIENNQQEYADYREWVACIFDSQKKAKEFIEGYRIEYEPDPDDIYRIEEHEVE